MIATGQSATTVRNAVRDAINDPGLGLLLFASISGGSGSIVTLTHARPTVLGNIAITETVTDSDFSVSGMSGGAGGDCAAAEPCQGNEDCESNNCMMNVCQ
jgi:hypothetical protein